MGTISPKELLKQWKTEEDVTPEMVIGQVLQNLVRIDEKLSSLQKQMTQHQQEKRQTNQESAEG